MFLYTGLVQRALADMARAVSLLAHVDPRRVLVVAGPRACGGANGNLAQCYALREPEVENFAYWYHPRSRRVVRVTPWARRENTRVTIEGVEVFYVILLRLPRLLMHQPLETLAHELVHIGPDFDGRLHRLRHGRRFDAVARECVEQWRRHGEGELVECLQMDFAAITKRWGSLVGRSFGPPFVSPRVRPLENPPPIEAHPDFRCKHLVCDPASVRVVEGKWTPANAPACLTERDLVYRVYTPGSARRIAASVVSLALGDSSPSFLSFF